MADVWHIPFEDRKGANGFGHLTIFEKRPVKWKIEIFIILDCAARFHYCQKVVKSGKKKLDVTSLDFLPLSKFNFFPLTGKYWAEEGNENDLEKMATVKFLATFAR